MRVAEDISDDGGVVPAKRGQLLGDKGAHPDVLQPDGIHHPAGGLAHSRGGVSGHWLSGKSFYHDSAQAVQVDEVGELDAVAKGAAGGNDGVFEGNRANGNPEVNCPRAGGPFGLSRRRQTHRERV